MIGCVVLLYIENKHFHNNTFTMDMWATFMNAKTQMDFDNMPQHNEFTYKFTYFTLREVEKLVTV